MRSLRIVVRSTRGALPLLVAATLAPVACGSGEDTGSTTHPNSSTGGASGAGGAAGAGGGGTTLSATTGIAGSIIRPDGAGGSSDAGAHCLNGVEDVYTVSLPPEGVPA